MTDRLRRRPAEVPLYVMALTPRQLLVLRRVLLRELLEGDELSRTLVRAWLRELDQFNSRGRGSRDDDLA